MAQKTRRTRLGRILDRLEEQYGRPEPPAITDPYLMIIFNLCGYPATDASCAKGYEGLKREIGLRPQDILAASDETLTRLLRAGGIVPELRARRLKEVALSIERDFGGSLRGAVKKPLPEARKALKTFPTIGDPGADKILLFSRTAPIAAVPSNCIDVPLRLGFGEEQRNYAASYRSAQQALAAELPEEFDERIRAYQLLKRHGREICKRTRPLCARCPVTASCRYFQMQKR